MFEHDNIAAAVQVSITVRRAFGRHGGWGETSDRQGHGYIWRAECSNNLIRRQQTKQFFMRPTRKTWDLNLRRIISRLMGGKPKA